MRQTELIMGMPISLEVPIDETGTSAVPDEIFDFFRHVDGIFSPYKDNSQISQLNSGHILASEVSSEVRLVLEACAKLKAQTKGYFDIQRNGRIDPSGYVKGWAIMQAANRLKDTGYKDFFIDAGGDIQACGHNMSGGPWRVGIKHPGVPGKFVKVVGLSNQAIATSGTYERGLHIYNPHNGLPVEDPVSLSVIGEDIAEADVMATAALAMGPEQGLSFLTDVGLEGLAITRAGQLLSTPGFNRYVV